MRALESIKGHRVDINNSAYNQILHTKETLYKKKPFLYIDFNDKIRTILYPQVRNSIIRTKVENSHIFAHRIQVIPVAKFGFVDQSHICFPCKPSLFVQL